MEMRETWKWPKIRSRLEMVALGGEDGGFEALIKVLLLIFMGMFP